jgi:hypothetical protein
LSIELTLAMTASGKEFSRPRSTPIRMSAVSLGARPGPGAG